MNSSILPKYSALIYSFNPETKYYTQTKVECQETTISRLPNEMRIAPAGAENVKVNATKVVLSRECNNGKYAFITGIQETFYKDWFIGNDYEFYRGQKVVSITLFKFENNNSQLKVYYFHKYDKPNTFYRIRFANSVIPLLKTQ